MGPELWEWAQDTLPSQSLLALPAGQLELRQPSGQPPMPAGPSYPELMLIPAGKDQSPEEQRREECRQLNKGSEGGGWLEREGQREQKINGKLPGSHLVLIAPVVINTSLIIRLSAANHMATLSTQSGPQTPNPPVRLLVGSQ